MKETIEPTSHPPCHLALCQCSIRKTLFRRQSHIFLIVWQLPHCLTHTHTRTHTISLVVVLFWQLSSSLGMQNAHTTAQIVCQGFLIYIYIFFFIFYFFFFVSYFLPSASSSFALFYGLKQIIFPQLRKSLPKSLQRARERKRGRGQQRAGESGIE